MKDNIKATYTYAESHHTVHLERNLQVRAVVLSVESERGVSSIDFILDAKDGPYEITLIRNPLIDYDYVMGEVQRMTTEREEFFRVYGEKLEPQDCSYHKIMGLWSIAHWYRVDEFADRMTVGMTVAAWEGTNREDNIFK